MRVRDMNRVGCVEPAPVDKRRMTQNGTHTSFPPISPTSAGLVRIQFKPEFELVRKEACYLHEALNIKAEGQKGKMWATSPERKAMGRTGRVLNSQYHP